jgi:hypothetical protein
MWSNGKSFNSFLDIVPFPPPGGPIITTWEDRDLRNIEVGAKALDSICLDHILCFYTDFTIPLGFYDDFIVSFLCVRELPSCVCGAPPLLVYLYYYILYNLYIELERKLYLQHGKLCFNSRKFKA